MPVNTIISARILALVEQGVDLMEAIDQVLGAGTSDALIDQLYEALRSRAVAD